MENGTLNNTRNDARNKIIITDAKGYTLRTRTHGFVIFIVEIANFHQQQDTKNVNEIEINLLTGRTACAAHCIKYILVCLCVCPFCHSDRVHRALRQTIEVTILNV